MLSQVHEHVVSELSQSTRTDTIFVVTAIIFNLTMLGINSGAAASANYSNADRSSNWIFAVFLLMTILVNIIAVAAFFSGDVQAGASWKAWFQCTKTMKSTNITTRHYSVIMASDIFCLPASSFCSQVWLYLYL